MGLQEAMVIHGDGRNVELLEEEGLAAMDAFICVTAQVFLFLSFAFLLAKLLNLI